MPNTLAVHDAHHLCVWCGYDLSDWGNSHIHRQIMIEQGDPFDMASREHWGIASAMNHVFVAVQGPQWHVQGEGLAQVVGTDVVHRASCPDRG